MHALKANPIEGMQYSSFILDDNQTFVHINMAISGETMSKLNEVAAFGEFRKTLKASGPISPPKPENSSLVGAAFDI